MMPLKSETSFGVGAPNEVGIVLLSGEQSLSSKQKRDRKADNLAVRQLVKRLGFSRELAICVAELSGIGGVA